MQTTEGSESSWRWAWPLGVLMALYLWVSYRYDIQPLTLPGGPLADIALVKQLPPFLIAAVTAMLLLEWSAVVERAAPVTRRYPPPRGPLPPLALAGVAGVFLWVTHLLFVDHASLRVTPSVFAAWGVLVFALAVAAFNLAIPVRGQAALARALGRPLGVGLMVGALAWAASQLTGELWYDLAGVTLYCVYALLDMLGQRVEVVPGTAIIGLSQFRVNIDASCSGYEGVGLIATFLGGYVWRFRDELRFPRALALPLVGAVLVWLLNNVRIAALILVGQYVSEAVAVGGFHSKAGWLFFCVTAIGLAWVAHRTPWLLRDGARVSPEDGERPAAPFLVPLIVLLAAGLITGMFVVGFDHLYPLRVTAAGIAAALSWKAVRPDSLRPHTLAVAAGFGVLGLWLAIVPRDPGLDVIRQSTLAALQPAWLYTWLAFRVVGAAVVVPLVEELAFRGFLLRRLAGEKFERIDYRDCPWYALALSSLAFGVLHSESWLAGSVAGAVYGLVVMRTGRLYDAVFAHGLTNLALAVYVLATGHYYLW